MTAYAFDAGPTKERDRLRGLIDRLANPTADKNLVLFSDDHILIPPTQRCSALTTASYRYTPAEAEQGNQSLHTSMIIRRPTPGDRSHGHAPVTGPSARRPPAG